MPSVYKVQHEEANGDIILYASSAEIVGYNSSNSTNLDAQNTQDAIHAVNEKAEGRARVLTFNAIITASAFDGTTVPYTQRISVPGILPTDAPDVSPVISTIVSEGLKQREAFGCVTSIETGNGEIIVRCYEEKPVVDVGIQMRVFR